MAELSQDHPESSTVFQAYLLDRQAVQEYREGGMLKEITDAVVSNTGIDEKTAEQIGRIVRGYIEVNVERIADAYDYI